MHIKLKVTPNANKNEIVGWIGDQLKVKINASPEKGKANKELLQFLRQILDLGKDQIVLLRGHTSQTKVVSIDKYDLEGLNKKLGLKVIQDNLL